jgi:hypothetical protein
MRLAIPCIQAVHAGDSSWIAVPFSDGRENGKVTMRQVEELKALEPWSRENGVTAFARRHGMTVPSVYHWRRKLGLPVAKWCGRTVEPRRPADAVAQADASADTVDSPGGPPR